MRVEVEKVTELRFADGSPVRAASAVVPHDGGWLVAQDDATHACWWRDGIGTRVRVLPAVEGHDTFDEESGTKHLKPDLEAALVVPLLAGPAALLLGSGSTPRRMRSALLAAADPVVADLAPLYAAVARALAVEPDQLNLEGACLVGGAFRWFQRGLPSGGLPTGSVDLDLAGLLAAVSGAGDPAAVEVRDVRRYDLGEVSGVGLAVTDAVHTPDGAVLVSAAAEDSPNAYDDGPVVGAALAVLRDGRVLDRAPLPRVAGEVAKVEGLAPLDLGPAGGRVLATVDDDDPGAPSLLLTLRVGW